MYAITYAEDRIYVHSVQHFFVWRLNKDFSVIIIIYVNWSINYKFL
jgi:hypothetical protein